MFRAVCSLNSLFYSLERKAEIKRGGIEESGHTRGQIEQESAHTTGTLFCAREKFLVRCDMPGTNPAGRRGER